MEKEFKTLKEIFEKSKYKDIIERELKAEVVKWVKNCECKKLHWGSKRCEACWRFINFFNLTESDLEEKE